MNTKAPFQLAQIIRKVYTTTKGPELSCITLRDKDVYRLHLKFAW